MSTEQDKIKHSKRQQQKTNHINRQIEIRKAHGFNKIADSTTPGGVEEMNSHRYHKTSGMTCGDPDCVMCGNPRKFFGEPTVQEQREQQDVDTIRNKRSNGTLKNGENE